MQRNTITHWAQYALIILCWSGIGGLYIPVGVAQSVPKTEDSPDFWSKLRLALNRKATPPTAQESVTERFEGIYDLIHREEIQLYDSLSKVGVTNWDRYQNIVRVTYDRAKDTSLNNNLNPGIKVFGWHPYWMGSAWESYQFNLMSYVAWFSYNIDSNGQHDNPDVITGWKNAGALVEAAHAKNCKVLLTVSNHTPEGNRALLKSAVLQDQLIAHLLQLLEAGNGDGIDLNFELVPPGLKREMTLFIEKLSAKLKPKYTLSLDLPAVGAERIYELKRLKPSVDWFVMMGYDYYGPHSSSPGPVAPLDSTMGTRSIRASVGRYLENGVPRAQFIVALPYYGAMWNTQPGAEKATFGGHLTYRQVKAQFPTAAFQYDLKRWCAHFKTTNPTDQSVTECWLDDTLTLRRKFDWIIEEKLAGTGIWALGYDNGYPEFWNLIGEKFGADTLVAHHDAYIENKYFNLSRSIVEYRSLLAVAGIFIVVFLMAGMVVALFDWRVRDVFFRNKTLRLLYLLASIAIGLFVHAFYLYVSGKKLLEEGSLLTLGIGLICGICLTLYINYIFEKSRKNMP